MLNREVPEPAALQSLKSLPLYRKRAAGGNFFLPAASLFYLVFILLLTVP
ncbi:TetR family transcriptional regulator [Clostridium sp. AM29-11AC]|nr:TetR family transcriptional regulator [Clostridium sp. AM29-11AC]